MRWFLRFLLFAVVYNISGNVTVFADKRVGNSSTSPVEKVPNSASIAAARLFLSKYRTIFL
jgi:hypothetical protein